MSSRRWESGERPTRTSVEYGHGSTHYHYYYLCDIQDCSKLELHDHQDICDECLLYDKEYKEEEARKNDPNYEAHCCGQYCCGKPYCDCDTWYIEEKESK